MKRRFLDKLENILFLFFVLQIQFEINGSYTDKKGKNGLRWGPDTDGDDVMNVVDFERSELPNAKAEDQSVELVAPKALAAGSDLNFGDEVETLAYSMLKSIFPLRAKSHSRQGNSGEHTPGFDYDWADTNSEVSFSSGIAGKLLLPDDRKFRPMSFGELCDQLEASWNVPMDEEELLIICRRIIRDDHLVKALNLPNHLKDYESNLNAPKICDILYAYLAQSGDLMSRSTSRNSHSTIDTPPNSPIGRWNSPDLEQQKLPSLIPDGCEIDNVPAVEVVEEIPKSHPFHFHQPALSIGLRASKFGMRQFPVMISAIAPLDTVKEERSLSDVDALIEEID